MRSPRIVSAIAGLLLLLTIVSTAAAQLHTAAHRRAADADQTTPIIIDDDNWQQILQGEWMLQFHAPWCPACRATVDDWNRLAALAPMLNVQVGKIDVTLSPALSGRFFITALPTILHVKNNQFRQYRGPRDVATLSRMLTEMRWQQMEPLVWWKHPDSPQMTVVSWFFKLSYRLKEWNTYVVETYKAPVWLTYVLFAFATIALGAFIGLFFVCLVDMVVPPRRKAFGEAFDSNDPRAAYIAQDDLELETGPPQRHILDDCSNETSDEEKNSGSDSLSDEDDGEEKEKPQEEEEVKARTKETAEGAGDAGFRKRKTRKAD